MEDRKPTILDIAKKAGVSKATVSRALRGLPGHSSATQDRIQAIALRLGYQSHPILSAVMSSVRFKRTSLHSPVIAEIHCQPWDYDREGNPADLRRSIHDQAEKQGYRVAEFGWYEPGMNPARLMNIVRARGIRAVVFEHFMEREVNLQGLDLRDLAMVSVGGAKLTPRLHRVEVNHYGNLIQAVKILQARGYRRFGVVIPRIFEQASDFKRGAALYSDDLNIKKGDHIPMFLHEGRDTIKDMGKWLKRHRPDCVLAVGKDIPAQLNKLGYSFPDDLGFAHLGWHSSYGSLAGMNPKWSEAGKVAANLIIDQLTRNEHGVPPVPLWILIEGEWMEGTSVRPPLAPSRALATR